MVRRCLGWTEPQHPPLILGEVAPLNSSRVTDGMCPECAAAMDANLDAMGVPK